MKWFRKNEEAAVKKSESFFDYDDSRDPWDLPTVRFFGKKSEAKGWAIRKTKERFSLAERFARDEDSPFWEEAGSRSQQEPDDMDSKHLESASQRYSATRKEAAPSAPVVIAPHQRLSDISPEEFKERQSPLFRKGPTLSARPQQNLQGCEIRFSHGEEDEMSFPQRVFVAEEEDRPPREEPRTRDELRGGLQQQSPYQGGGQMEGYRERLTPSEADLRSSWRPPERVTSGSVKAGSQSCGSSRAGGQPLETPPLGSSEPSTNEAWRTRSSGPEGGVLTGAWPESTARPEPEIRQKRSFKLRLTLGVWLKALAVLIALSLIAVALLTLFSKSNPPPLDEEGLLTIPSPEHIKVRPTEPNRALIPYQDELIYGQLDNLPEPEVTNPIRPVEEDLVSPPVPSAPASESVDEYLDGKEPREEASYPMRALTPEAVHTQKKLAQFVEEEEQKKAQPVAPSVREVKPEPPSIRRAGLTAAATPSTSAVKNSPTSSRGDVGSQRNLKSVAYRQQIPQERVSQRRPQVAPGRKGAVYLQLGALTRIDTARAEATRLAAKYRVFSPYQMVVRSTTTSSGREVYLILLGPIESEEKARALLRQTSGRFAIRP